MISKDTSKRHMTLSPEHLSGWVAEELTIPNLPPVPFDFSQVFTLINIIPCAIFNPDVPPSFLLEFREELSPNTVLFMFREILIVYHSVNSTYESVIKLANSIGR